MTNQMNVVYLDKFDFLASLGLNVQNFFAGLADLARKHAAHRELMKLDDRMLADIGLERGNLQNAVAGK